MLSNQHASFQYLKLTLWFSGFASRFVDMGYLKTQTMSATNRLATHDVAKRDMDNERIQHFTHELNSLDAAKLTSPQRCVIDDQHGRPPYIHFDLILGFAFDAQVAFLTQRRRLLEAYSGWGATSCSKTISYNRKTMKNIMY